MNVALGLILISLGFVGLAVSIVMVRYGNLQLARTCLLAKKSSETNAEFAVKAAQILWSADFTKNAQEMERIGTEQEQYAQRWKNKSNQHARRAWPFRMKQDV